MNGFAENRKWIARTPLNFRFDNFWIGPKLERENPYTRAHSVAGRISSKVMKKNASSERRIACKIFFQVLPITSKNISQNIKTGIKEARHYALQI